MITEYNYAYRLNGHNVVPCKDFTEEMQAWQDNRIVAKTTVAKARISTVFLVINHAFSEDSKPVLFETMIFGGPHDGYQERCSTWAEAELQHVIAVNVVRSQTGETK